MPNPFVAVGSGCVALAASRVVCYTAGRCQFNRTGSGSDPGHIGRNYMISRRTMLGLIGTGVSTLAIGRAFAAEYPARPVRFLVGYPPGGATDIIARLIGQRLSEKLGQQFVTENKPGAGNNISTDAAVNAEPHGHTALLVNPAHHS